MASAPGKRSWGVQIDRTDQRWLLMTGTPLVAEIDGGFDEVVPHEARVFIIRVSAEDLSQSLTKDCFRWKWRHPAWLFVP